LTKDDGRRKMRMRKMRMRKMRMRKMRMRKMRMRKTSKRKTIFTLGVTLRGLELAHVITRFE
jgi:hypothetical protein